MIVRESIRNNLNKLTKKVYVLFFTSHSPYSITQQHGIVALLRQLLHQQLVQDGELVMRSRIDGVGGHVVVLLPQLFEILGQIVDLLMYRPQRLVAVLLRPLVYTYPW